MSRNTYLYTGLPKTIMKICFFTDEFSGSVEGLGGQEEWGGYSIFHLFLLGKFVDKDL